MWHNLLWFWTIKIFHLRHEWALKVHFACWDKNCNNVLWYAFCWKWVRPKVMFWPWPVDTNHAVLCSGKWQCLRRSWRSSCCSQWKQDLTEQNRQFSQDSWNFHGVWVVVVVPIMSILCTTWLSLLEVIQGQVMVWARAEQTLSDQGICVVVVAWCAVERHTLMSF